MLITTQPYSADLARQLRILLAVSTLWISGSDLFLVNDGKKLCRHWNFGFSSREVWFFQLLYFMWSKIRNLIAANKDCRLFNIFRFSFFSLRYHRISLHGAPSFSQQRKQSFLLFALLVRFFCNAMKIPNKHQILTCSIFKNKRKNPKWKVYSQNLTHGVSSFWVP